MGIRLPIGFVVAGRYRLGRALGEGGMGTVHEAWDEADRPVAVKALRPDVGEIEGAIRRFEREAELAARVVHPNVARLIDSGVDPRGLPFLVYEMIEGIDLKEHLATRGRLPIEEAVSIVKSVLDGLEAAHAQGIVHRDVKPSNVLLAKGQGGERIPKLIDFGIAKAVIGPEEWVRLTTTGAIIGTVHYMSPEQASGRAIDARSDVWSAGATLYELLASRPPFDERTPTQVLFRILSQEPPDLGAVAPGVPPALVLAVRRALARDRDARWPTASAFGDALAAAIPSLAEAERTTLPGHRDPTPLADETEPERDTEP
jgi:serine/threonine-protein kinase